MNELLTVRHVILATLAEVQSQATILAQKKDQVVGEKREYFITLQQLDDLLQEQGLYSRVNSTLQTSQRNT